MISVRFSILLLGQGSAQVLQRDPPTVADLRLAGPGLPTLGDLPGDAVLLDDHERVAGTGHAR